MRQEIPILAEMRKKMSKMNIQWNSYDVHGSSDTMFPWHGHTSFEISMRQENPVLAEMRKKISQMNIQWNSYDVP